MGPVRYLLMLLLLAWPPPHADAAASGEAARLATADQFLALLEKGDYEAAQARLAGAAAKEYTPGRLRASWEALPPTLGPLLVRRPGRPDRLGGKPAVLVRLEFEEKAVEARLRFNRRDQVDGFWLVPADMRLPLPPAAIDAPPPVATSMFTEREFPVGDLGGTLTLPRGAGPFPAVVIVHGSGPADRDNTHGPNKPFLDLAYGLAERGVMVLRFDKRTWLRAATLGPEATAEEVQVRDVLRAVRQLRALRESDDARVFVVAHSLGGYISPRIAARDPGLAGLVLLAGLARPLYEAVPEQVRYLTARDGLMTELETASLREVERQRDEIRGFVAGGPAPRRPMLGIPNAYWLDHGRMRPVPDARALAKPMLLLQGERDYQVTVDDDLRLWREGLAGHPDVRVITYPALNHLFLRGEGPPGPEEYRREGRFDAAVIADIAAWIGQH
ncbi:alpha/beta hydrolase family protein [Arenimonas sp.]|uniref:alpha/beta hydrolase family protein n=1 Tax=Arenimonas sp. TaxID=1872635 RepID=UPI0035B4F2C2